MGAGNLASVYYDQGLLDSAILYYKQALLLDSSFIEAYNNLVWSDYLIVPWVILSVKAVVLDRLSATVVYGLGRDGATWACDAQWLVLCMQGNALKDAGRVEEAIACYQVQEDRDHTKLDACSPGFKGGRVVFMKNV